VKSSGHFLVSVVVGAALVPVVTLHPALVVGLAVGVGVGIDFDHFLLARLNTGSWRALAGVVRNPRLVFAGQDDIFEQNEVWRIQRLLSHVVIGSVAVPVLVVFHRPVGIVVGASLYAHVVTDLVEDVRTEETYVRTAAAALDGTTAEEGDAERSR
jgi:hypothetical protein